MFIIFSFEYDALAILTIYWKLLLVLIMFLVPEFYSKSIFGPPNWKKILNFKNTFLVLGAKRC